MSDDQIAALREEIRRAGEQTGRQAVAAPLRNGMAGDMSACRVEALLARGA